jgi:hypothetical protein
LENSVWKRLWTCRETDKYLNLIGLRDDKMDHSELGCMDVNCIQQAENASMEFSECVLCESVSLIGLDVYLLFLFFSS